MRTIYIDSEYKCHVSDDGTMTPIETNAFDGKCDAFIEGFCYDTSRGYAVIFPWKDYDGLDAVQRAYEQELLAELQANSIPISELEAAYQKGVNGAYD